MLFLLLTFLLLAVVLGVALTVGTLFFQGYVYTEPSPGLFWRAPAAGAALAFFYTLWSLVIVKSDASIGNIPYDTVFRFSPKVDMTAEPVPVLWALRADGTKTKYIKRKGDNLRDEYQDERRKPYNSGSVIGFEVAHQGSVVRLDNVIFNESGQRTFLSAAGWQMDEFENGPTGVPTQSRWGRFLGNLLINLLHGGLWFVCLWLLLQFRFNDALGAACVLWLTATVMIVPPLLDRAATIAASSAAAERPKAAPK